MSLIELVSKDISVWRVKVTAIHTTIALAVYSRSPAAFEAIKHLGFLQLPSSSSLQAFMSSHQHDPGANEEHMELQNYLYEQHVESKVNKGSMKPKRDGILIFHEVKVQGVLPGTQKKNR